MDTITQMFQDPFSLLMLGLLAVLIIFMFRSSRKRQAAARALQEGLKPGVEVMLQSGIYGTVLDVDNEGNKVSVQSGPGTTLVVHRNAISTIIPEPQPETLAEESAASSPEFGENPDPDDKK